MDFEKNRFVKWFASIILSFIALSMIYFGTVDTLLTSLRHKKIASIDGKDINTGAFITLLNQRLELLRKMNPNISKEDIKQAQIPERFLREYVGQELLIADLKRQGFLVSDKHLSQLFEKDAKNIAMYLKTSTINKRAFVDTMRTNALTNQLFVTYDLPFGYKNLVTEGLNIKRNFDYVEIMFNKIHVNEKPDADALKKIQDVHKDELKTKETRSFNLIIFDPNTIKTSDKDVQAYYKGNPQHFNTPEQRDFQVIKTADERAAEMLKSKLMKSKNPQKLIPSFKKEKVAIDDQKGVEKASLPQNLQKKLFVLPKNGISEIFHIGKTYQIYIVKNIKAPSQISFKGAKQKIIGMLQADKNKQHIADIRKLLEGEDVPLKALAEKFGYKLLTFANIEQSSPNVYAPIDVSRLMAEVYHLQKNEVSDIIQDTISGLSFVVETTAINPEKKLSGQALRQKLHDIWTSEAQKEIAQKWVDDMLALEKDEKAFASFATSKGLSIKKMSINAFGDNNLPQDFVRRVMASPLKRIVFSKDDQGFLMARTLLDVQVKVDGEQQRKQIEMLDKSAFSSLDQAFFYMMERRHIIKISTDVLDSYLGRFS